ncbi:hypothetical protein ABIB58_001495 [Brevundimonas sp. UYEF29]|uniref:AlbA family DNA-binding domain-containing protein n=1 Tax=Brevundimonas TaxID=41275 RepID=UPI003394DD14
MTPTRIDDLSRLIAEPTESLSLELKRWIDPTAEAGKQKIICAVAALYNHGGGYLVIGIDDKTRQPADSPPSDPRSLFNDDVIQGLVSRHLTPAIPVEVRFVRNGEIDHPVLIIPTGVRTPAVLKKAIGTAPKDTVYVRTLHGSGVVSTAPACAADWPVLMQICFDNREADIAGFIRRHLASSDLGALTALLPSAPRADDLAEITVKAMARGRKRYEKAMAQEPVPAAGLDWGRFEIAVVADPPQTARPADQTDRRALAGSDPNFGGMALWYDGTLDQRPVFEDGGLECRVIVDSWFDILDFMRFEPAGVFYQNRLLDTDASARQRKAKTQATMEPRLTIQGVGESLAAALIYMTALGWDPSTTTLGVRCRWTGVQGRNLISFTGSPMIFGENRARDDAVESFTTLPLETASNAVAPFAAKLVAPLLALFNGYVLPGDVAERSVQARLERQG